MITSRSHPARSRLGFYSCYVYSPAGEDEVSRGSRLLCARVKAGNRRWLRRYVAAVRDHRIMQACVQGLSCAGSVLVPIPPSDSSTPTALWPSHLLALALCNAGLAASVWIGIRRGRSIARSSQAWRWERPSVFEHYRSLALERPTSSPMQVLLIDDVVTKGRTLMAAALRLRSAFPHAQVRAFALVRTLGFVPGIRELLDPCQGEICWNGTDTDRQP